MYEVQKLSNSNCNIPLSEPFVINKKLVWTDGSKIFAMGTSCKQARYTPQKLNLLVSFQVLTAASMKFRVFWDIAPCSHVEKDRRFRGA
jgi:hypothetical protein